MRQILYYYYNINFDIDYADEDKCVLKYKNDVFLFKRLEINQEILQRIITTLINYNIRFHTVVLNTKKELISTYKNNAYVLLKIEKSLENSWFDFNTLDVDYHTLDIGAIWEKKIDYYINAVRNNGEKDIIFLSIFNYYIGMSENAIAIVNRVKQNNNELKRVISHRRIDYPFNYINYFDPTEMIIDYRIRDYSEYLKSKLLNDNVVIDRENKYVMRSNFTNDEVNVLVARLLYPSYYFDLLEKWIDAKIRSDELLKFIEFISKYETFLNDFINSLSSKYAIYQIDWIKK